jgi:hypothetical protein
LIRSQSWHARVLPSTCHAHRQCRWPLHATRASVHARRLA